MATWSAAARSERVAVPQARPRPVRAVRTRKRVTSGVFWIGFVAALLAGVVAMNVAVLRLNMKLDRLGRERANLQAQNAALSSQLSSAAATGRIQQLAMRRLGFVPASPEQTRFVHVDR